MTISEKYRQDREFQGKTPSRLVFVQKSHCEMNSLEKYLV